MATEDTRISDLEKVIKVYESEYTTASAEDKRLLLLQLITAKQETLNRLLAEKKAPSVAVWYLCESTVTSLHKHGLRGSVYDLAGLTGGFHSNQEKTSITYENPQLLT
eukprot:gene17522-12535_t